MHGSKTLAGSTLAIAFALVAATPAAWAAGTNTQRHAATTRLQRHEQAQMTVRPVPRFVSGAVATPAPMLTPFDARGRIARSSASRGAYRKSRP